jgi:hypothetical protein
VAAAVVTDRGPNRLGDAADAQEELVEGPPRQLGGLLERRVQVVDVGLVVLGVVDLHSSRVDVRFERVVRVRELRKGVRGG